MGPRVRTAHKQNFFPTNIKKVTDPTVVKKYIEFEAKEVKRSSKRVSKSSAPQTDLKCRENFYAADLSATKKAYKYSPTFVRPFESRPRDLPSFVESKIRYLLNLTKTPISGNKPKIIPVKGIEPCQYLRAKLLRR
jgi:hypothetical protein